MLFFFKPKRFDHGHWLIQGLVKLIKCLPLENKTNEKRKKKAKKGENWLAFRRKSVM